MFAGILAFNEKAKKHEVVSWATKGKDGVWVDSAGKKVSVSASPKKTKFFTSEADAEAAGYVGVTTE